MHKPHLISVDGLSPDTILVLKPSGRYQVHSFVKLTSEGGPARRKLFDPDSPLARVDSITKADLLASANRGRFVCLLDCELMLGVATYFPELEDATGKIQPHSPSIEDFREIEIGKVLKTQFTALDPSRPAGIYVLADRGQTEGGRTALWALIPYGLATPLHLKEVEAFCQRVKAKVIE